MRVVVVVCSFSCSGKRRSSPCSVYVKKLRAYYDPVAVIFINLRVSRPTRALCFLYVKGKGEGDGGDKKRERRGERDGEGEYKGVCLCIQNQFH